MSTAEKTEVLLTVQDVAKRWQTDPVTVRRAIAAGRLPAINLGVGGRRALWRIRLSDLNAFESQLSTTKA